MIIQLGDADPNVAHIPRNHFALVERFVRNHPHGKHAKWLRAVLDGAIIGLANGRITLDLPVAVPRPRGRTGQQFTDLRVRLLGELGVLVH